MRILFILFFILSYSCSDGKIEVLVADFTDNPIKVCVQDTTAKVFFKIKSKESIILEFQKVFLTNKALSEAVRFKIPSQVKVYYRTFSKNVSEKYFCDLVPPIEPSAVKNIEATGGELDVSSTEKTDEKGKKSYIHLITIKGLILISENGDSLVNENLYFGEYITYPPITN